jgi:glycosyltransferase involved in cell wall biosynthesis
VIPRILIAPRPNKQGGPGIFLSRIVKEFERRGIKWTSIPFHYTGYSLFPWDVAFTMGYPRNMGKILKSRKPYVATIGAPEFPEYYDVMKLNYLAKYKQQENIFADLIARAEKIVFISNFVRDTWVDIFNRRGLQFPNIDKYCIIHHGLDINNYSPSIMQDDSEFILGTSGHFREKYRVSTFFAVSRLLKFKHKLLIIGSMNAECRKEYEMTMLDPAMRKRTEYVPWVKYEELPNYYRRMHCLFHPRCGEPYGIVVAEAISCGVPVVVPAYGGPKEIIGNIGGIALEVGRWVYDDNFNIKMASAVTQIRENWHEYTLGARRQAIEGLGIEDTVDKYISFLGISLIN